MAKFNFWENTLPEQASPQKTLEGVNNEYPKSEKTLTVEQLLIKIDPKKDNVNAQEIRKKLESDAIVKMTSEHKKQLEQILGQYSYLDTSASRWSLLMLLASIEKLEKNFVENKKAVETTSQSNLSDISQWFIQKWKDFFRWMNFWDSIDKLNHKEKLIFDEIQDISLWDISDKLEEVIARLKQKLEDESLSQDQKELIEWLLTKLNSNTINEINKIDKEFNNAVKSIMDSSYPATIKIFWKDIIFDNKEQALEAVKLVKIQVKNEITSWLDIVKELALDLLLVPLIPVEIIVSEWNDALQHWLEWEYLKILYADILPWALGAFITTNILVFIGTAVKQSGWKLLNDTAWRLWMWLMEDFSRRWNIQVMDPSSSGNSDILEYFQRESIISWLRVNIEWLSDAKLKNILLSDLENLEKFKLIKSTDTFYYKAYLIWKHIWLKNFINPKYLWIRLMGFFVDWWKLIYPDFKNEKFFNKFKPVLSKEWISFSKQYFTPEINHIIEQSIEELRKGALEIYSNVNLNWNANSRRIDFEIKDSSDWASIRKMRNYIKWLRNITEEERLRREKLLDRYKERKMTNPLLTVDKVQNDLCKIAEIWIVDINEFKSLIEKELKDIFDKKPFLKDFLNSTKDMNLLLQDLKSKIPLLDKKAVTLYNLIKHFKAWDLEITKTELSTIVEKIKKWESVEIKSVKKNIENVNQIFETWEKLEKQFNEGKSVILWNQWNKLLENLIHVIDLDRYRFDESSQEVFEKILEELKSKVDNWKLNYTGTEAKIELVKLYNWILPNFVVIDIVKWINTYWTKLESHNFKKQNVIDFINLVETWKWFGWISDLKYVIEELKKWNNIKDRHVYYDMLSDIDKYYDKSEILYEKIKEKMLSLNISKEVIDKTIEDLKNKVELKQIDVNSDTFKADLSKLIKWILPEYMITEFIKWTNDFWLSNIVKTDKSSSLDINKKNVIDFLKKVNTWKWHWNIEDLKYVYNKLLLGEEIKEKVRVFSVSKDISDINKQWPILFDDSFKNSKYGIEFDWNGLIKIDEFKKTEFELAKFYHKMNWKNISDSSLIEFLSKVIIKRKIDYSWVDFFNSVLNELGLLDGWLVNSEPKDTRSDILLKIWTLCKWEVDKLTQWYKWKNFDEKEKVITELKNIMWISTENKNSPFIEAMKKAWVNLGYIVDMINIFEEERKELKSKDEKNINEAKNILDSINTEIKELESYRDRNTARNMDEYNQAKSDLTKRWVTLQTILPVNPDFTKIIIEAINNRIKSLIEQKISELRKIYWSISNIPSEILDNDKDVKEIVINLMKNRLESLWIELELLKVYEKAELKDKLELERLRTEVEWAKKVREKLIEIREKAVKPK